MAPTVMRGSSDAYGSWKMICMSRDNRRSDSRSRSMTLRPSNQISPDVGSIRRSRQRPVVDLPQPDSPTSPSVSPRMSSKLTPATACTWSVSRPNSPLLTGKFFTRSLTRPNGSDLPAALKGAPSRSCPMQHAGDLVAGLDFDQRGSLVQAFVAHERTPRGKPATWRRPDQAGHRPGNRLESAPPGRGGQVQARD